MKLAGKGRPVLFVHGGPGSTSYYFEAQPAAALLEDELQMIYFDQRGAGLANPFFIEPFGHSGQSNG